MDILVLGAYGMLGHRLMLDLGKKFDVVGTARTERRWNAPIMDALSSEKIVTGVDATDLSSIRSVIDRYKPRVVLNCIGIVKQAETAKDPITSITINSLLPHQLARMTKGVGGTLIHFSTDCIFSGRDGNYSPDQIPDPVDLYGRSKLLGEVRENGITIRSSLIGREIDSRNGLVEWFLSNRGKNVTGFRRAIFSGFATHEMAKVVEMIIDKAPVSKGIWQVASDPISKFDLITKIGAQSDARVNIVPDDTVVCDRSLNGEAFSTVTGYRAPDWDDMIKSMVKDFPLYEGRE
jgi:dTDP-4-dehydrorhamnose reductase